MEWLWTWQNTVGASLIAALVMWAIWLDHHLSRRRDERLATLDRVARTDHGYDGPPPGAHDCPEAARQGGGRT